MSGYTRTTPTRATGPRRRAGFGLLVAALAVLLSGPPRAAQAHELPAQRAVLVLRDERHLSVQWWLDAAALLHRVHAPQQPAQAYLAALVAQGPAATAEAWEQALARLRAGCTLHQGRSALVLERWQGPSPEALHAQLQQQVMAALVPGDGHAPHAPPISLSAEARSREPLQRLRLAWPPELGPLLVVHYRPRQQWVDPRSGSAELAF